MKQDKEEKQEKREEGSRNKEEAEEKKDEEREGWLGRTRGGGEGEIGGGGQTTSAEVRASRLLDVLPAHLIPGGGGTPSSMSRRMVFSVDEGGGRKAEGGRERGKWQVWRTRDDWTGLQEDAL